MTARELIFSGFAWLPMFGQDAAGLLQERPRLPNVDRLCGRLISVRDVDSPVSNRSTPLTPVAVRLHRWTGDNDCCNGATVAAELVTGRRGKVEFKKVPSGLYWIALTAHSQEFNLLVRYEPGKGQHTACSDLL
jgi:hypothetical protein